MGCATPRPSLAVLLIRRSGKRGGARRTRFRNFEICIFFCPFSRSPVFDSGSAYEECTKSPARGDESKTKLQNNVAKNKTALCNGIGRRLHATHQDIASSSYNTSSPQKEGLRREQREVGTLLRLDDTIDASGWVVDDLPLSG